MPKIRTLYHHLKIEETANIDDIRAAFTRYFLKYHPDRYSGNRQRAERLMKLVSEVYTILSNPEKRAGYDAWLVESRQQAQQETTESVGLGQQTRQDPELENAAPVSSKKFTLWKVSLLIILLAVLAYAAWFATTHENFKTSVLGGMIDSPLPKAYGFVFENKCQHPVTLVVRYRGLDDEWHIDGWWGVGPGESFYLEDENGKRLASQASTWYYYARTTNDANIEWKGKSRFTYDKTRLPMIKMEDTEGDSQWSTSCD